MTSRFVVAGGEEVADPVENDEWARARKQVAEKSKPQPDASGAQEGGKSLYDHLQAQKVAKQEAFEEATKLRNQFRPLDDSEVEFLDTIKRKEDTEAAEIRKTTAEQLAAFRKEQAAIEKSSKDNLSTESNPTGEELDIWTTTKKRRRPQADDVINTVTHKKVLTATEKDDTNEDHGNMLQKTASPEVTRPSNHGSKSSSHREAEKAEPPPVKPKTGPILVAYDSDSDT